MLKKLISAFLIAFLFISVPVPVQAAMSETPAVINTGESSVIFANFFDDIIQDVIGDAIKQWFSKLVDSFFGGKPSPQTVSSNINSSAGSGKYVDPSYDPANDPGDGCYREETIDGQAGFWYQGRWYWRWTNDVGYEGGEENSSGSSISNIPHALTLIGVGQNPNLSLTPTSTNDSTADQNNDSSDRPSTAPVTNPSTPANPSTPTPPAGPPDNNSSGGNMMNNTPQNNSGAIDLLGQEAPYVNVPDASIFPSDQ